MLDAGVQLQPTKATAEGRTAVPGSAPPGPTHGELSRSLHGSAQKRERVRWEAVRIPSRENGGEFPTLFALPSASQPEAAFTGGSKNLCNILSFHDEMVLHTFITEPRQLLGQKVASGSLITEEDLIHMCPA